jgi:long-chain acyl-CoA synthetase
MEWEDAVIGNMPLFHCYGNLAIMNHCLLGRHPLALIPNPRDLDDLLATIQKVRPAVLCAVPTLLTSLLNHPQVQAGKVDLRSIKLCMSSAAPPLAETKNRFEAATGGHVLEGYAMTESMVAACFTPINGTYKPGSVGVPLPDVEVRILDADDDHTPLSAGQVGEIVMRAPQLMLGYWQRPAETAQMLRDGWLYTGDLGYMDEDGYLFIVDRKKDLIKPSGFQVWPREVEEAIAAHPAVSDVCVVGVPDAFQGEAVKAWVVLKPGETASARDIQDFCRTKLVGYKLPKEVEFVESLPKTMVGKTLRRLLREQA